MPNNIEEKLSVTIDSNPKMIKPILFTVYDKDIKYNLHIVYEDETTKDIELVQKDKNRPYRFVFKREGKLITATGVPTIHEISEPIKMCDFVNTILDCNDLLFELDCSNEYECNKVRFYLKDVRDIIDLTNEPMEDLENTDENHSKYPIYLNGYSCDNLVPCNVVEREDGGFSIILTSQITKAGEILTKDMYSEFDIFSFDSGSFRDDLSVTYIDFRDNEIEIRIDIEEELIGTVFEVIVRYLINEINHPIFDEFSIMPIKDTYVGDNGSTQTVLKRAVSTQDMQYLGDGLKPALGVGITPGYKEYKNKKSYNNSVLESAT